MAKPIGNLIGIGVGPGDPELITIKGVRILQECDRIFVPQSADKTSNHARTIISHHVETEKITELEFALGSWSDNQAERESMWDQASTEVIQALCNGQNCVFATIGDPNLFSTFTYIARSVIRQIPEVQISTVPGIMALQHTAAQTGAILAEENQTLALIPLTGGIETYAQALEHFDTVVAYKGARHLDKIGDVIAQAGRSEDIVFAEKIGQQDEHVQRGLPDERPHYLSTVVVSRNRFPQVNIKRGKPQP